MSFREKKNIRDRDKEEKKIEVPQPSAPRCCFEQHQKRMKHILINADAQELHTR